MDLDRLMVLHPQEDCYMRPPFELYGVRLSGRDSAIARAARPVPRNFWFGIAYPCRRGFSS